MEGFEILVAIWLCIPFPILYFVFWKQFLNPPPPSLNNVQTFVACCRFGPNRLPKDIRRLIVEHYVLPKCIYYDPRCGHRLRPFGGNKWVHDMRFSSRSCNYWDEIIDPCLSCWGPEVATVHRLCFAMPCRKCKWYCLKHEWGGNVSCRSCLYGYSLLGRKGSWFYKEPDLEVQFNDAVRNGTRQNIFLRRIK